MADEHPRIFVSYAREDQDFATRLATDLRNAGVPIWMDQLDLPAGVRWDDHVEFALRNSGALLVILSPRSVSSAHVKDEIADALDQGKPVLPVLMAECEKPYRIRRLQHVDFSQDYARGLERLLRDVRASRPATPPPVAPLPPEVPPPERAGKPPEAVVPPRSSEPDEPPVPPPPDRMSPVIKVVSAVFAVIIVVVLLIRTWPSSQQPAQSTPPTPSVHVTPGRLDFGTQSAAGSKTLSVMVTPGKIVPVELVVTLEGSNPEDFVLDTRCLERRAKAYWLLRQCPIGIAFKPQGVGHRTALLTIVAEGQREKATTVLLNGVTEETSKAGAETGEAGAETATVQVTHTPGNIVQVETASCIDQGDHQYKIELSGTVAAQVGAVFSANGGRDPSNVELGTVCERWRDLPPRADFSAHRVCQRRASDPGMTSWRSWTLKVGKPPQSTTYSIFMPINEKENKILTADIVPLQCR